MLFAKTSLNMPATSLVLIGIISNIAGIGGSLVWPRIQRALGWSNLRVLVTQVCLASLLPAYGCLGFLPVFRNGSIRFGGLTTPAEMYVLSVYFVRHRYVARDQCAVILTCLDTGHGVRSFPELRPRVLLGAHPPRRGGPVVRSVLYYGQGSFPSRLHLAASSTLCSFLESFFVSTRLHLLLYAYAC